MGLTKAMLKDFSQVELFREFLSRFNLNVESEHLVDTPARVIRMYEEMLSGYEAPKFKFTTFDVEGTPSMVVVSKIPFHSLCSHHMLPFRGLAHVGYLPSEKICGLSKLARAVKHFSARLQVQENLTGQIADYLVEKLAPKGLGVVLEAEHFCMSIRGVKAVGAITSTSAVRGLFLDDPSVKEEFFREIERQTNG